MEREEIVKALRCCWEKIADCDLCPYNGKDKCIVESTMDAVYLLESDSAEINRLKSEITAMRQNSVSMEVYRQMADERDAAVAHINDFARGKMNVCSNCKKFPYCHEWRKHNCKIFEWRGPQSETAPHA